MPLNTIDIAVWLTLFAPALFVFIIGGGYWYYAAATTSSLSEAAEKFKIYTWALFPAASLAFAVYVFAAMPADMRQTLISGVNASPLGLLSGLATGLLIGFVGCWAQQRALQKTPQSDVQAFLTSEWRELPGLIIIAPIAEELMFRGYGSLALNDLPVMVAALITSAAFALIHVKPWLIVFSFFVGLILFFLFYANGDLLTVIIAHAATNAITWIWMRRMSKTIAS